ncbi:hypothetical protein S1OALGB6SA_2266 [Olavius algarvensis spirochete endosymbiont]|nr:hypothetical protein S1OALGB6SA_2266 [Olavius algarvensis spirochete endosymbiont]
MPAKVLTTQAMLSDPLQDVKRPIRAKTRILLFIISHVWLHIYYNPIHLDSSVISGVFLNSASTFKAITSPGLRIERQF